MAKFYQVKKEFGGVIYTAQFNGISAALEAIDGCYIDGTMVVSSKKLADYLFEHVIVDPKGLTADDFDSMDAFNEVTIWARGVMEGKFRDKKEQGEAEAGGTK